MLPLPHKVTSARNSFCITCANRNLVLDEPFLLPSIHPKILNKITGAGGCYIFLALIELGMIKLLSGLVSLELLYLFVSLLFLFSASIQGGISLALCW